MNTIDTRGHLCPMPLIMLIKALKEQKEHLGLNILTDNEISKKNILSFLNDNNYSTECNQINDYWSISIVKDAPVRSDLSIGTIDTADLRKSEISATGAQRTSASPTSINNQILVVNRDKMGHGSDELAEILIKGFFNALTEVETKPEKIIFYNSGVLLCKNTFSEINSLKKLKEQGIDIILCGACVDYFQLKDDIAVGRISNMLSICEILMNSEKVMYL